MDVTEFLKLNEKKAEVMMFDPSSSSELLICILWFEQIWSTVEFKRFVVDVFHFDIRQALHRDYFINSFNHHRIFALFSSLQKLLA